MTTKISKALTVLVTVLSLAFLGATAVSSIARTDWKTKANEFPRAKTAELQVEIDKLKKQADDYAALTPLTVASIAADLTAMELKAARLNQYAVTLETEDKKLREINATTAVTAQAKLDTDKLRREEIQRLQAQYEELVSQRAAAQAEVLRLRDLLYQSRGVLQRAVRRNASLKDTLGQPTQALYDPTVDEENLPRLKPTAPGTLPAEPPAVEIPADDDGSDEAETETEDAAPATESVEPTPLNEGAEGEDEAMESDAGESDAAPAEEMPAEAGESEDPSTDNPFGTEDADGDSPTEDQPEE
ncbi:MAG: hypothetical protein NT069_28345 [Planctomycetota bacterium]|nr:hypothetical protein [Planctomycetota bacterium]